MFSRASVQAGAAPHILKNVRDLNVACYQASPVSSVPSWPKPVQCPARVNSQAVHRASDRSRPVAVPQRDFALMTDLLAKWTLRCGRSGFD
jgi:hypothetical protein